MTLAYDVQNALPGLRAEAEALMVDAVTITRTVKTWDEATDLYVMTPTTVYGGKCRVKIGGVQPANVNPQGQILVAQDSTLSIPVNAPGSPDVQPGDTATITACLNDAALVGAKFRINAPHRQTFATAHRFPITELVEASDE